MVFDLKDEDEIESGLISHKVRLEDEDEEDEDRALANLPNKPRESIFLANAKTEG